jgi:hypothetical protein
MKYEPEYGNSEWTYLVGTMTIAGSMALAWHLFPHAILLLAEIGRATAPYAAVSCLGLAAFAYFRKRECRNRYDLAALKEVAAGHWPTSNLGTSFDPDRYDDNWAPSKSVAAFFDANRLRVGDEATTVALVKQLGERWHYANRAPLHVQCLAVVFALHADPSRRKESDAVKNNIAATFANGAEKDERDAAIHELLAPHLMDQDVLRWCDKTAVGHAYVATVLMAMLSATRTEGGVLGAAEFLWLKGVDRPLWYALNNVGRRLVFVEGAGAVAHFEAECHAGIPLTIPHVEAAEDSVRKEIMDTRPAAGR